MTDRTMLGNKVSHYKIIKKLGEGGMGQVYLADDFKLEHKVLSSSYLNTLRKLKKMWNALKGKQKLVPHSIIQI